MNPRATSGRKGDDFQFSAAAWSKSGSASSGIPVGSVASAVRGTVGYECLPRRSLRRVPAKRDGLNKRR
jgi:hypothetical protein